MTTMLDKAAEALCARTEGRDDVWHDLSAGDRDGYKDLARAALQAIREPSDEVAEAGTVAPKGHIIETHEQRKAVFCVMWNAALDAIENEEKA